LLKVFALPLLLQLQGVELTGARLEIAAPQLPTDVARDVHASRRLDDDLGLAPIGRARDRLVNGRVRFRDRGLHRSFLLYNLLAEPASWATHRHQPSDSYSIAYYVPTCQGIDLIWLFLYIKQYSDSKNKQSNNGSGVEGYRRRR